MGLQLKAHVAGLDLFAVQDVVDQPDQALAVALGDAHEVSGLRRQLAGHAAPDQPERAAYRGQRRAQFMADGGDELTSSCGLCA
jgi:predicted aminopeptidase